MSNQGYNPFDESKSGSDDDDDLKENEIQVNDNDELNPKVNIAIDFGTDGM